MIENSIVRRVFVYLVFLSSLALLTGCEFKKNKITVSFFSVFSGTKNNDDAKTALAVGQQALPNATQARPLEQVGGSVKNTVQPVGGPYLEVTTCYQVGTQQPQPLAGIVAILATTDGKFRQQQQTDSQGTAIFSGVPIDRDIEIRFLYSLTGTIPGRYWITRKPVNWPGRLTSQAANSKTVIHLRQTIHHWSEDVATAPVLQPMRRAADSH